MSRSFSLDTSDSSRLGYDVSALFATLSTAVWAARSSLARARAAPTPSDGGRAHGAEAVWFQRERAPDSARRVPPVARESERVPADHHRTDPRHAHAEPLLLQIPRLRQEARADPGLHHG